MIFCSISISLLARPTGRLETPVYSWCFIAGIIFPHNYSLKYWILYSQPRQKSCWAIHEATIPNLPRLSSSYSDPYVVFKATVSRDFYPRFSFQQKFTLCNIIAHGFKLTEIFKFEFDSPVFKYGSHRHWKILLGFCLVNPVQKKGAFHSFLAVISIGLVNCTCESDSPVARASLKLTQRC